MLSVTFSIKKSSGNQRELWMHIRIFGRLVVSKRIFRCHAKQHKAIRAALCSLRFWTWRKPVALLPAVCPVPSAVVLSTSTDCESETRFCKCCHGFRPGEIVAQVWTCKRCKSTFDYTAGKFTSSKPTTVTALAAAS